MISVRALSGRGTAEFGEYLLRLRANPLEPLPRSLLTAPETSAEVAPAVVIDDGRSFETRFDFGTYLAEVLSPVLASGTTEGNVGLWSWLALCYFDLICPPDKDGGRKPKATHRYILSADYKTVYRHLVRSPCLAVRIHGGHARFMLDGPPHKHSEAAEQTMSRDDVFRDKTLIAAMDKLYMRSTGKGALKPIPGATGKGGGTYRRMGKVMKQFELTFDISGMQVDRVLGLLPVEFNRFKA